MSIEGQATSNDYQQLLGKRYTQLLGYIAELDRLRTTTVSTVDGHPEKIDLSMLPEHPSVVWTPTEPSAFLIVTRSSTPESPPIHKALQPWVQYEPNQITVEPSIRTLIFSEGQEVHWEEHGLVEQWELWLSIWRSWATEARPAFEARELYAKLYDLHATLERSSEQVELVAADVAVALRGVDHPILLNPAHIELDVERSRITVGCLEEPSQVYGDAIRGVLPEAGDSIAKARKEVAENPDIWAFGGEEVDLFGKRFVQGADPDGEFIEGERRTDRLTARRAPWLLLRKRATGLAELAEGLLAKFVEDGEIPTPIQPILLDQDEPKTAEVDYRGEPDEDELSFFTKPANAEQLAILRNYRRSGCVHVQGPPGTGKTHTIANLIGHFLAEGKTVLVTSEKAQALTVLREKVVEELRPLCVSLVGSDAGEGLKAGMRALFEKLGGTESGQLQVEVERLTTARERTIQALRESRHMMREIIEREHRPIEVRGWRGSPVEAGRYVREQRANQGWIPGSVATDSEPPLTQREFDELLNLLVQYSGEVVPEVRKPMPPAADVPSPREFRSLLEEIERLEGAEPPEPAVVVPEMQTLGGESQTAKRILHEIDVALMVFKNLDPSYRELANRAVETSAIVEMWVLWRRLASEILDAEPRISARVAPYNFVISGEHPLILDSARKLLEHVSKSGRPITKPRLLNRQDKVLFESVRSTRAYGDETGLQVLIDYLEFTEKRDRFRLEVRSAAQSIGLEGFKSGELERQFGRDSSLNVALRWASDYFEPIAEQLLDFSLEPNDSHAPVHLSGSGTADRMAWWLEAVAQPFLLRHLHYVQLKEASASYQALKRRAAEWKEGSPSNAIEALASAIDDGDASAYQTAHDDVTTLRAAAEPVQRRDALLEQLRACSETFAASLEDGNLDLVAIQGSLDDAWTFAQIEQELARRNALSLEKTKEDLDRLKRQLDETTIRLASARAWVAQHRRVTQPVRSALSRFHEAQRRVGGGKGMRVPDLLRTMRNAMREAKDAFPVWIMPLHDLSKSFDFTQTRFDVVIVDESSQLSAVGLITLLIADSAIVVGDDEQTEPSLAGVSVDSVMALIREHLVDFTDRVLWSPDSSLYSFAGRFGATVGLREHFRCVPQIISFSSKLCYQGKIQALRESRGVVQVPHVVPIRCNGLESNSFRRDLNESEATEIASLVIACSEQPEYQGQSFGVISLRGSSDARGEDPQTSRVTGLVRAALGSAEWERFVARTRFKTGVPPAFQGDERDVVFISVGDDPASQAGARSGPLSMLGESTIPGSQFKKRLNVAVSRARNQVWVVHSFAHFEAELKEGDIRRKLLEFAYAPDEWLESTLAVNAKAESPFEQAVYADLVRQGFTVTPQVAVGQYRIDLVAEDADARVAIECDGDAYHQDAAADLSRQIVLERCGWQFVRVRGSEYYRDPEGAIQRIVRELERLGVTPGHAQPEQAEPEGALLQRVRARAQEIRSDLVAGFPVTISASQIASIQITTLEPLLTSQDDADIFGDEIEDFGTVLDEHEDEDEDEDEGNLPPDQGTFGEDVHISSPSSGLKPTDGGFTWFAQYVVFSETGFEDPKNLTESEIQADLVKIITVEGPATETTVVDRYRVATGYGRFKGPTRDRVVSAQRNAIRLGKVRGLPDYPGSDVIIYSLHSQPEDVLRSRGPRDFFDIPMAEIVKMMDPLIRMGLNQDEEALFRIVLEKFELKRLTEQARQRLQKALELALAFSP